MMATLNQMYDDFTADTCWFLMTKEIALRIKFSTPNVNKTELLVVIQSSQSVS
jgi:hypothetical protein